MSPDRLSIRDGKDTTAPIIRHFCNTVNSQHVTSSGNWLHVELLTNAQVQRQGFAAIYFFLLHEPHHDPDMTPHDHNLEEYHPKHPKNAVLNNISTSSKHSTNISYPNVTRFLTGDLLTLPPPTNHNPSQSSHFEWFLNAFCYKINLSINKM